MRELYHALQKEYFKKQIMMFVLAKESISNGADSAVINNARLDNIAKSTGKAWLEHAEEYEAKFKQRTEEILKTNLTTKSATIMLFTAIREGNRAKFDKLIGDPQTELEKKLADAYWTEAQAAVKLSNAIGKRTFNKNKYKEEREKKSAVGTSLGLASIYNSLFVDSRITKWQFYKKSKNLTTFRYSFNFKKIGKGWYFLNVRDICDDTRLAQDEIAKSAKNAKAYLGAIKLVNEGKTSKEIYSYLQKKCQRRAL